MQVGGQDGRLSRRELSAHTTYVYHCLPPMSDRDKALAATVPLQFHAFMDVPLRRKGVRQ